MSDNLSKDQRSYCMSCVKGQDTKGEYIVRSLVHRMGFRFRLHRRDLPGNPDIVLPKYKKIIFVHGCFWHMHNCKKGKSTPATHASFWQNKRDGNKQRDRKNIRALKKLGWKILIVWECHLKNYSKLQDTLRSFLSDK